MPDINQILNKYDNNDEEAFDDLELENDDDVSADDGETDVYSNFLGQDEAENGDDLYSEDQGDDVEEDLEEGLEGDDLDNYDVSGNEESKFSEEGNTEEIVTISKSKILIIKKLLDNIKENNDKISRLLAGYITTEDEERINIAQAMGENFNSDEAGEDDGSKIVEGVFDGEGMVGSDGKLYNIPANYASKSKLVEGDILKLTITPKGTFMYKQIGPIERKRIIGVLEYGSNGNFVVAADGKKWRVLTASITYFKGQEGDEAIILVPKNGESQWAAVDNVIRRQIEE